ncbi:MAG TPA: lipase [Pseudonocardiaceae bacterium]|nr:lipase [Pseudonocardiaceae bacterium]
MTIRTGGKRLGAAVCIGLIATAALTLPAQANPNRGALLGVTPIGTASQQNIIDDLTANHFTFTPNQVHDSVHAYRLTYRTVDHNGRPTTASGLFVLPDTNNRDISTITYLNGTMSGRDEAPSVEPRSSDRYASYLYSSAGYATVAPDYVGLGTGPGLHPYLDVADATAASVDMLDAARTAARQLGRNLRPEVYVNGFSQGGVVALGLGRALQAGAVPGLRAVAIAPISGPYELQSAEIPAALASNPRQLNPADSAFYLAYVLVVWQRVYHIYDDPSAVFQAPYDKTVPPLFNGDNDENAIFPKLPSTPEQLITPAFLAQLRHPSGRLLAALRANDATCSNWLPRMPIRFFYADGDEQVSPADTQQCQADFAARGVASTSVDVGNVGHSASAQRSVTQVLSWFERRR